MIEITNKTTPFSIGAQFVGPKFILRHCNYVLIWVIESYPKFFVIQGWDTVIKIIRRNFLFQFIFRSLFIATGNWFGINVYFIAILILVSR